jgi:hypothetical protein
MGICCSPTSARGQGVRPSIPPTWYYFDVFTFDQVGNPVACHDQLEWARFVAGVTARGDGQFDEIVGRFRVQTYFVGLDLRGRLPWGPDPLIWETWVNEITGDCRWQWPQVDYLGHATRRAAAVAHRQLVSQIRRGTYKPTGRRWDPNFQKDATASNEAHPR